MGWYCTRCGHEAAAAGACPRDGEPLARVSAHDLHGRTLGEYRILATLGGGAYGSVYRAIHVRSGMLVAIKLLHRPIDDAESKRVMVEARAAATIDHPNVAKVYDLAVTSDRRPYIVMQLLDGKPLSQVIAPRLDLPTALSITNDVLAALAAAHARGVIHRDLKPDNIFITKGRALIVDFGLAKLVADPRSPSLTATGEALGTPAYMAPEQVRGEPADHRADLYAVGCVLFEMLAGRPPFEGSSTYVLFDAHLHQPPPSLASLRPELPPAIVDAVARVLAKAAADRPGSADELQRALAGHALPRRGSRKIVAIAAAAAVVSAITAGAIVAATRGDASHATTPPDPRPHYPVPPPLPGDPPLDPKLETSLRSTAEMFASGQMSTRADVLKMRCAIQTPIPREVPPELRAYLRRLVVLLDTVQPGIRYPDDCVAPPAPPQPKRVALPGPLPDEGAPDPSLESIITTLHDQLDADRLTVDQAADLHCQLARQDARARDEGRLHRTVRGLHRRIDALLEAYRPGSTTRGCR